MKKILVTIAVFAIGTFYLSSCYNNKYDLLSLAQVSFVKEVVPLAS